MTKAKAKPAPKSKQRDPEEYKRFLETAKDVGADESAEAFDGAFKKVVSGKSVTTSRPK